MINIIFLNSHPIQYYAPLYKELTHSKKLNIQVWYCSDHGINEDIDIQFGRKIKWDIPLLEGYNYLFLKNNSIKRGINNGFFGLINLELISKIRNLPKDAIIVVPGWNYLSYWIAFLSGFLFKKRIAFRSESPLSHEKNKTVINKLLRNILFKHIIFKRINFAFYVGIENLKFYEYYNVDNNKLIYTPYCVDNNRFQCQYEELKTTTNKLELRNILNVPSNKKIILYSGKFYQKKKPT